MHFLRESWPPKSWCGAPLADVPRKTAGGLALDTSEATRLWRRVTCAACQARARQHIRDTAPAHLDLFPLPSRGQEGA